MVGISAKKIAARAEAKIASPVSMVEMYKGST